jgi:predicted  nucleic acid-binding Zn-ribbon protein
MKRINALTKQLDRIEKKQEKAEKAFNKLVEECANFDNFLRENNNPKPEMQLLRAYLQQYEDERVAIERDIEYSYSQINDLKDDIAKGLYDETKRDEYLTSEETAAKTLEAKLDYFIDRFEKQSEFIKTIEKQ